MDELHGQVVVITGAGRGIGRAMAGAFAREGARVALVARSAAELKETAGEIRAAGGSALPLPADITDLSAVEQALAQVEAEWSAPDVVVNNAGSFGAIGPVWEVDPERWWRDVTVNLRGTFHCTRTALGGMVARNRGRIINVIGGGTGNPFPYGSGYAGSKAAVMRLTECAAAELKQAGKEVAVFAMGPGLVRTRMTEYQLESEEGQRWMFRIEGMFAEGVDVPPTRAAELAVQLACGRFDHLTGRCFSIGMDLDDLLRRADEVMRKDQMTLRFR